MNISKILTLGIVASGIAFGADANNVAGAKAKPANNPTSVPSLYDMCADTLAAVQKQIPANALSAKLTLIEAQGKAFDLKKAVEENPVSPKALGLAAECNIYAAIIKSESDIQTYRSHISENWEKRAATNRSIEAIQEQIANARSGQVSNLAADLEAEKARLAQTSEAMKAQEEKLQAEMQQNREKFEAEAAAQEAALKAANQREEELRQREAELQKQLEAEKLALEAERKALAEERAKAELRQKEAMDKLNELQSKLIQVTKDARGIILSMSDILFDVDKATLKQDLKTSLAKVAGILTVYQQFNVSIEGNTDNTGSEEHNMKLSEQRATNVMNFLIEQGIDASRLNAKGLGMTMPVADNSTKEGRQKNRRVDLVIQDKALLDQPAEESVKPEEPAVKAAEEAK